MLRPLLHLRHTVEVVSAANLQGVRKKPEHRVKVVRFIRCLYSGLLCELAGLIPLNFCWPVLEPTPYRSVHHVEQT